MADKLKKLCEKYDAFIGFNFLSNSDSLEIVIKEIQSLLEKKKPIGQMIIDKYNKKLITSDINKIIEEMGIKDEALIKAILYGKTMYYYQLHPISESVLTDIIVKIWDLNKN